MRLSLTLLTPEPRFGASALALLIALAVGATACERPPAPEAAPVTTPEHLVAVAHLRSIDATATAVQQYVDAAIPGAGQTALAALEGMLGGVAGLDRTRPVAILLVARPKDELRAAAVVSVGDAAVFATSAKGHAVKRRGKLAVIGDAVVVDSVGPWALRALPAKLPWEPKTLVHVAVQSRITAVHLRQWLAEQRNAPQARAELGDKVEVLVDALSALADVIGQSDRVEALVDLDAAQADFIFRLAPRRKTALADFVAAQAPSDFSLLERVDHTDASFIAVGNLTLGPASPAVWSWVERLAAGTAFAPLVPEARTLTDLLTGHAAFAGSFGRGGLELGGVYTTADAAKAKASLAALAHKMRTAGPLVVDLGEAKARYEMSPDAPPRDGVKLHQLVTTMDYSASQLSAAELAMMPQRQEMAWGAWDDVVGLATAKYRPNVVARSRTRSPAAASLAQLLDAMRARNASVVEIFDYGAIFSSFFGGRAQGPSAPMSFWLSFAQERAELGVSVPASTIAAAVQAVQAATGGGTPPTL